MTSLDQLNSLVEGHENQIQLMISGNNISEVVTMAQHLELPIAVRRECNKRFVKCTAKVKGGKIEAFIWMKQNVEPEVCRQVLDDMDSSSTCKEELVRWTKANATPRCCKTQSQRKYNSQINLHSVVKRKIYILERDRVQTILNKTLNPLNKKINKD